MQRESIDMHDTDDRSTACSRVPSRTVTDVSTTWSGPRCFGSTTANRNVKMPSKCNQLSRSCL